MTNTTKIVIISSASSVVSSAVVGFLCYVKGKQSGMKAVVAATTAVHEHNGGRPERAAHA